MKSRPEKEVASLATYYVTKWENTIYDTLKSDTFPDIKDFLPRLAMLRIYKTFYPSGLDDEKLYWQGENSRSNPLLVTLAPRHILLDLVRALPLGDEPAEQLLTMTLAGRPDIRVQDDLRAFLALSHGDRRDTQIKITSIFGPLILQKEPTLDNQMCWIVGTSYFYCRKYDHALKYFQCLLEKDSNCPPKLYAHMGACFMFSHQYEKACYYLSTALQKGHSIPNSLPPWTLQSFETSRGAFESQKREAEASLREAEAYLNLACRLAQAGEEQEASLRFQQFIRREQAQSMNLHPDTLNVIENVFKKTGAASQYFEWVQKRRNPSPKS
jgi:tetratricopeptide (TPR) repeat protein